MLPVVILAGGLGTRLTSITGDAIPKVLVPVAGRPFIDWKLDDLARNGITDALLLVGHLGEPIIEHVGDGSRFGLRIECVADGGTLLGTGGAIQHVLSRLPAAFWVTYGDSLVDVDLANAEAAFAESGQRGLMSVWKNRGELGPSNALVRDRRVVAYSKNPAPEGAQHIDYGMLILTASAFGDRPESEPRDEPFDLVDVLADLAEHGELGAFEVPSRFYEIGDPAALRETEEHLGPRARER